jgi:hypothetical protein
MPRLLRSGVVGIARTAFLMRSIRHQKGPRTATLCDHFEKLRRRIVLIFLPDPSAKKFAALVDKLDASGYPPRDENAQAVFRLFSQDYLASFCQNYSKDCIP